MTPSTVLTAFVVFSSVTHLASIAVALLRLRRSANTSASAQSGPAVSVLRPLCGIDNHAVETLTSTFELDYPDYEILFCVASPDDPVVPLVKSLMANYPGANAELLVGDDRVSLNPKLNNLLKGWRYAAHDWIAIADSNVLMPPDYLQRLFATWRDDTGLVASPPIGCRPAGMWAEIECAFLNTYQARWQYLVDSLGWGFAQGKTMLWRRADLDAVGGISALAREVAEDAAATKVVRDAGLRVRLLDAPLAQPLGRRSACEVWNRQVRWARLRRASFLPYFLPEILSGGVLPAIAVAFVAGAHGAALLPSVLDFALFWYGGEMVLAAAAGWHLPVAYPFYGIVRDLLLPLIFFKAWSGNGFVWRDNDMQVAPIRPLAIVTSLRPRMHEMAQGGRRRLRALRARLS